MLFVASYSFKQMHMQLLLTSHLAAFLQFVILKSSLCQSYNSYMIKTKINNIKTQANFVITTACNLDLGSGF